MTFHHTLGRKNTTIGTALKALFLTCGTMIYVGPLQDTAIAQDKNASGLVLEDIIVTARKREESLQDTPIAITALSGMELERLRVSDITDIAAYAPNVDISFSPNGAGGGGNSQITIRGVGQTDFLITTDPAVGVYLDGVYFARSTGGVLDVVGLSQVEVLRGPQGTLFGRNTIGGAISLTSTRPSDTVSGYGEITLGSLHRIDVSGGFDLPLIKDKLLSNFVFLSKNADGYSKRLITGEDLGNQNSVSARATFLYTPASNIEIFVATDYSRAREHAAASTSIGKFNGGAGLVGLYNFAVDVPSFLGTAAITNPDTGNIYTTNATGPNRNDSDVWGLSATVSWEIRDNLTFKSITAYRGQHVIFGRDGDNSPLTIRETNNDGDQTQFSQEIQFLGAALEGRLNWVSGLFYFNEKAKDFNKVRLVKGLYGALEALPSTLACRNPATAPPPCLANPFFLSGIVPGGPNNVANNALDLEFDTLSRITNKSYAAFFHGTYDISEKLSVTAGARYTHDAKDFYTFQKRINSGAIIIDAKSRGSFNAFSPKLGIEFRPNDDLMTYASYSRGFKAGGFNGRPLDTKELTTFNPEKLDAYEVGFKVDLLGKRLRTNISAFYNKYKDIQLTAIVQAPDGSLVVTVDNAAAGKIKGVEAEFQAVIASNFDLFGAVSYLDTQYTDIGNATTITKNGIFVKSPKWTANVVARYTAQLKDWGQMVFQGQWSYKDKVFNDVQNSPEISQGAYSIFNASISLEPQGDIWRLTLFGKNLFNQAYIVNGVTGGPFGMAEAVVGRPREWGVALKANF